MRVILDECLPRKFGRLLVGHDVLTVAKAGFAGITNGELLRRIDGSFDAFITVDQNLSSQQNVSNRSFGIIVLRAPSNSIEDLAPLAPGALDALAVIQPGQLVRI